jgi:hypothetical protein
LKIVDFNVLLFDSEWKKLNEKSKILNAVFTSVQRKKNVVENK